jgi:hypothetical protein
MVGPTWSGPSRAGAIAVGISYVLRGQGGGASAKEAAARWVPAGGPVAWAASATTEVLFRIP